MVDQKTLDEAFRFLDDYVIKHDLFSPTGDSDDGLFTVLHVMKSKDGQGVEIVFGLTDDCSDDEPQLPALGQQCVDAVLGHFPDLKKVHVEHSFYK